MRPDEERRRATGQLLFAGGSVDLTPPAGTPLAGYLARGDTVANGTLDSLEGTLVRIREPRTEGGSVTWVAIDALAVDEGLAREIAGAVAGAIGDSPESVVVCASHTHSAPSGWLRGIPLGTAAEGNHGMRADLVACIAGAAARLVGEEIPVRPALAVGEVRGIGTNRTDPDGPTDRSVGALSFTDEAGAVRGVLIDAASHATVLGHENTKWSADWPGAARRALAKTLGSRESSPSVALLQGAAGDSSTRFVRRAQSPEEVERIGGVFAEQVSPLVSATKQRPELPPVAIRRTDVTVPTRYLPSSVVLTERVVRERQAWEAVGSREGEGSPAERIARTRFEGALAAVKLADAELPRSVGLPISVAVVGRHAWLHLPVELFASFAHEIRAHSPFSQTRVIGYADGYFGYVADADAHRTQAYEAASSLFDPTGSKKLVNAAIAFLQRTYAEVIEPTELTTPA